jgi:hypothetical protein
MGSITIERRSAIWRDVSRSYIVTIDGGAVGKLRSGETKSFPLDPGPHEIRMKIDWCGSPTLTVEGAEDTRLVCAANGTAVTVLLDIIARSGTYIALDKIH